MSFDKIYSRITKTEIPDFEKKIIQESFKLQKFRKNQIIIADTEDCNQIFFIINGVLRIFHFNELGTEITRTFTFENEFCTNLTSFSQQSKNAENIQCLEDSLVFSIERDTFYKMLKKSQFLTEIYSRLLEQFVHLNLQHFQFMNTLNERQRIEKFLNENHKINARVKDKIIASYLKVSPEFFSRVKNEVYK